MEMEKTQWLLAWLSATTQTETLLQFLQCRVCKQIYINLKNLDQFGAKVKD